MKDFLIGVIATVVLCVLFSVFGTSDFLPALNGFGTQFPGEYGPVLPGGGELPAAHTSSLPEDAPQPSGPGEQESGAAEQQEQILGKEQNSNMNEILIAFWHGVATVLIGEICALAVATAWLKLKVKELKQHDD